MSNASSTTRILAILDVFSEDRLEWTSEELMHHLGFSRPTLYRYLKILKEAGFLTSTPNATFSLGPRVTELDFLMRQSDPLIRHGSPYLENLSRSYPCSAFLVRWYGQKILCVASSTSTTTSRSSYPRGRPMPMTRGAISRAILAFLPKRQQIRLIEDNSREFALIGLGDDTQAILHSLREIKRDGVAVAFGEVTEGVVGVAAPVFGDGKAPIGALCTTNAQDDVGDKALPRIMEDVRRIAAEISAHLLSNRDAP